MREKNYEMELNIYVKQHLVVLKLSLSLQMILGLLLAYHLPGLYSTTKLIRGQIYFIFFEKGVTP